MPPWAASLWYTSVCFGITTPARTKTLHGTLSELEQLSSKHLLMIDQEKWYFQFILVILKDICWQYVNMKHEEQEGLQGTQSCTCTETTSNTHIFFFYNIILQIILNYYVFILNSLLVHPQVKHIFICLIFYLFYSISFLIILIN